MMYTDGVQGESTNTVEPPPRTYGQFVAQGARWGNGIQLLAQLAYLSGLPVNRAELRAGTKNLGSLGKMRHYRVVMTQWKNLQLQQAIDRVTEDE